MIRGPENINDRATDLVRRVAGKASKSPLNGASGRVDVGLESGGLVVRHVW